MIEHTRKACPTCASERATKVCNEDFVAKDFDWHGCRKDFDYGKLNSSAIKAFVAKNNVKKFKVPIPADAIIRALEANIEKKTSALVLSTRESTMVLCCLVLVKGRSLYAMLVALK